MLTDVVIVAIAAAMGVWGYSRGADIAVLAAAGFGIGAVLGSRIGPQLLDGGIHDPLAPAAGLPGGLLIGGLTAAAFERVGYEAHRRVLRRRHTVNAVAGAALAVLLGVVVVWILGGIATRLEVLNGTVRDSAIVAQLNSALPPPGPVRSDTDEFYLAPSRTRPGRQEVLAVSGLIKYDPDVAAARDSVVKVHMQTCEGEGSASGWVAAQGVVLTNAHVVHDTTRVSVRLEGEGLLEAKPISYDERDDLSLLSVPGVRGVRPLRLGGTPTINSHAAVLGFPRGKHYKARAARVGPTVPFPKIGISGGPVRRSTMTFLRNESLGPGPGSSGGPVVDDRGYVVGTISLGFQRYRNRDRFQAAVASSVMKRHLRRALASPDPDVDTGSCAVD